MSAPGLRALQHHRRLARRTLPSLLRYKFLHEYGYDKGEIVVDAIVADICGVVRNYFVSAEQLEPGQLLYHCPAADERARKGKTMAAHTKLVPVRLTVVAQEDIEAIRDGLGAPARRDLRIPRLAHQAHSQGGVLSELDLSLVTGYTDGGVSAAYHSRLRHIGVGRRHAGTPVLLLVADNDVRILTLEGQLIGHVTINPNRIYQPQNLNPTPSTMSRDSTPPCPAT